MRLTLWLLGIEIFTFEQSHGIVEVEGEPAPPGLSSDHFGFSGE